MPIIRLLLLITGNLRTSSFSMCRNLGGLPDKIAVEVDPGIQPSPKTVGELRKMTASPENLAVTIPQQRDPNSAVKVSKANVATCTAPKS